MTVSSYLNSDDQSLIQQTIKGDSRAFGEIVRRYELMVARTVKGMLGDNQAAEDIGQDVFIRLYNSLGSFRGDSKLGTYIQRIAINLSLNEIKRDKRSFSLFRSRDGNDKPSEIEMPDTGSPGEEDFDMKEVLSKAMDELPEEYRLVVVLRLIQGYNTKESAEILELPEGTVLSRLSRAREQLQEKIKQLSK